MSEYWVSKDKYFCKYCNIFIADDKPSRNLHETGLRHKGNYERFIRDIYKRGAKDQRDKAEEEREIARIDAAANAAMQADGFASTSAAAPRHRAAPVPSSSDPYANYSTAESLGFVDHEADNAAIAELEVRKSEGRIGEWQRVAKPAPLPRVPKPASTAAKVEDDAEAPVAEDGEEEAPVVRRGYLTEKTRSLDDDDLFDPSKVQFKLKRKRLTLKEEEDIKEEALEKARIKKEEERRERRERKKAGLDVEGGWAEVALEEEALLMFDQEEEKPDEGAVEGALGDVKPDVKPTVAAPTFKKRKGNSAVRSKT
ncbi:hypothetical protein RQP46_004084 [Phenoliferia psychrophenolica]